MDCTNCHRPLKESVYNANRTKKSCPKCSQDNGSEHVFYDYPSAFGTTAKRANRSNPDGPQSYCTACRGSKNITHTQHTCSQV